MGYGKFPAGMLFVAAFLCCGLVGTACAQEQENPYANHSVLVETFVVELTTEAVRQAGADIVGRDPAGISISKLLWALRDEDNGRVLSGLKANLRHGARASAEEKRTEVFQRTVIRQGGDGAGDKIVNYEPYQFRKSCTLDCRIIRPDRVYLRYTYAENIFVGLYDSGPPLITELTFNSDLFAVPGVPVIAGASQDEDTARLLVFVVTLIAPAEPPAVEKQATVRDEDATASPDQTAQTVTFHKNMSLVDALRMVGEMYKVNIILSPKTFQVRNPLPVLNLYDVTFEEILDAILGDFRYVTDGKFIRVYTAEEFSAIEETTQAVSESIGTQMGAL